MRGRTAFSVRSIERRATELLKRADALSLPVDLDKVASYLGARVHRETLEDEVSGVLIVRGAEKHILVNKRQDPRRQRFTIGHELGHLVLHDTPGDRLIVDKQIRVYRRVGEASSTAYTAPESSTTADEEHEANLFAAAALMPASLVRKAALERDLVDEDDIGRLSKLFAVSDPAMLIRLQHLNLLQVVSRATTLPHSPPQQALFA